MKLSVKSNSFLNRVVVEVINFSYYGEIDGTLENGFLKLEFESNAKREEAYEAIKDQIYFMGYDNPDSIIEDEITHRDEEPTSLYVDMPNGIAGRRSASTFALEL